MIIARVIGNVVSVAKVNELRPAELYVVEFYNYALEPAGKYEIAIDSIGVGIGDYVLTCSGSAARMSEFTKKMPSDTTIMARIDNFELLKKEMKVDSALK